MPEENEVNNPEEEEEEGEGDEIRSEREEQAGDQERQMQRDYDEQLRQEELQRNNAIKQANAQKIDEEDEGEGGDERSRAGILKEKLAEARKLEENVKKGIETVKKAAKFASFMSKLWAAVAVIIGTWEIWLAILIILIILLFVITVGFCKQNPCQCAGGAAGGASVLGGFGEFIYNLLSVACKATGKIK